jgi:hypothetical protein
MTWWIRIGLVGVTSVSALALAELPTVTSAPATEARRDAPTPTSLPTSMPAGISIQRVSLPGPVNAVVTKVDLSNPKLKLVVVPSSDQDPDGDGPCVVTLDTVRSIAERNQLAIAINASFFSARDERDILGKKMRYYVGNPAFPVGYLMVDGKLLRKPVKPGMGTIAVLGDGSVVIASNFDQGLPADTKFAVSGDRVVLVDGKVTVTDTEKSGRHPRSAVGLSADGKTLLIAAIDGRRKDWSRGLTYGELGQFMLDQGAHTALNLDGGGSTTLVARDDATEGYTVLNWPSDGSDLQVPLSVERAVTDAIGVKVSQ